MENMQEVKMIEAVIRDDIEGGTKTEDETTSALFPHTMQAELRYYGLYGKRLLFHSIKRRSGVRNSTPTWWELHDVSEMEGGIFHTSWLKDIVYVENETEEEL